MYPNSRIMIYGTYCSILTILIFQSRYNLHSINTPQWKNYITALLCDLERFLLTYMILDHPLSQYLKKSHRTRQNTRTKAAITHRNETLQHSEENKGAEAVVGGDGYEEADKRDQ